LREDTHVSAVRNDHRYRALQLVAALALVAVCAQSAFGTPAKKPVHKTPLTSVEAVTDPDATPDPHDPGTGGGIDTSNYFSRKLASKISACTDQVQTVATTWIKKNHFSVIRLDRKAGDLLIHAATKNLPGLFEVAYTVSTQRERARVTVFYYLPDGSAVEPTEIKPLLSKYHVDLFQDSLTNALLCGSQ
jgi:hypothetical protein